MTKSALQSGRKLLSCGSGLAALLFGVALGNVVYGVPLDNKMEFTGNFFTLLRPVPLLFGITGLAAILVAGRILRRDEDRRRITGAVFSRCQYSDVDQPDCRNCLFSDHGLDRFRSHVQLVILCGDVMYVAGACGNFLFCQKEK